MKPYYQTELGKLYHGDCIEVMKRLPDNSIDTICTDPPYGIGFMGKEFDTFKPKEVKKRKKLKYKTDYKNGIPIKRKKPELVTYDSGAREAGSYDLSLKGNHAFQEWCYKWSKEAFRIAKPGCIMLCFGGTRTFHRLTCAIEDAGWEIRDCLMWIYGSGFPKSYDISKGIDKQKGCKKTERRQPFGRENRNQTPKSMPFGGDNIGGNGTIPYHKPTTPEAKLWNGYGTALKPAWEPIILAMKPVDKNFVNNALKHGVAGLWIDGGRIETKPRNPGFINEICRKNKIYGKDDRILPIKEKWNPENKSRFPSNLILDEESARMLDEQSGELSQCGGEKKTIHKNGIFKIGQPAPIYRETFHGASRFFYVAKASPSERNEGLEDFEEIEIGHNRFDKCNNCGGYILQNPDRPSACKCKNPSREHNKTSGNIHPTVKPIDLMRYLVRLTRTPTGGTVLDLFAGSGTTGIACEREDRKYILIEKELEYCEISKQRLKVETEQLKLKFPEVKNAK